MHVGLYFNKWIFHRYLLNMHLTFGDAYKNNGYFWINRTPLDEIFKRIENFFFSTCKIIFPIFFYIYINNSGVWVLMHDWRGRHLCWSALILVLSYELKFFECLHFSIWGFRNPVRHSVPEKRNHLRFVNINPTVVIIDTSMERSSST